MKKYPRFTRRLLKIDIYQAFGPSDLGGFS